MAATVPLPPLTPMGRLPRAPAEPQQIFTLTAADRCDVGGCGARAHVRVVVSGMLELRFCAHHGHEKRAAMVDRIHDYIDESAAILRSTGTISDV